MSTYSAQDPAFSHTGAGPVANARTRRCLVADVVFVFGYGAWALSSLVVVFGLKMGGKKPASARWHRRDLDLWSILTRLRSSPLELKLTPSHLADTSASCLRRPSLQ